jgi:hypothetical protein
MNIKAQCLLLALMTLPINATTRLAGELHDTTFTLKGNPYFIDDVITIPKGVKVTIEDGCIFLFNPYTGIDVNGSFVVKGKPKSKVVFTSINDAHYNPTSQVFANAFDWNGITFNLVSDTVLLENFVLSYSVYGVKSMNGRMVIHNGTFKENGQYDCVINETIQKTIADSLFSYNYSLPVQDTLHGPVIKTPLELKTRKKNILALSFLGLGLGSGGLDGFFISQYYTYRQKASARNSQENINIFKEKRNNYKIASFVGAGMSGALLISAFFTYIIPVKADKENKESLFIGPVDGNMACVFRFDF